MNGRMTRRAGLVFLREVVRRPDRSLGREGMALQAQQTGLAHPQQARVRCSVSRMTAGTTFRFHRQVLKNERALLVGVALDADGIAAGHVSHIPQRARAMKIVAIRALHKAFIHPVVVRLGEVRLGRRVTAVTELRLGVRQ
jgi:hypothetical protein